MAILTTCLLTLSAQAAAITQAGGAGAVVTTGASGSGGALRFNPSPSVLMAGSSTETTFAIAAGHNQAVGKADGKAFGLAADSNKTYWLELTADTVVTNFADTDSSTFNASWNTF